MSITNDEYEQWLLSSDAQRVMLVELPVMQIAKPAGETNDFWQPRTVATSKYVSFRPQGNAQVPVHWLDIISEMSSLALRIDAVAEVSELVLVDDGSITHWYQYLAINKPCTIRFGDARWPLEDFRVVVQPTISQVTLSPGELRVALSMFNQKLSDPFLDELWDERPMVFGTAYGVTARQSISAPGVYDFNGLGQANGWGVEVRDGNGPVIALDDYAYWVTYGRFKLSAPTPRQPWLKVTNSSRYRGHQVAKYVADELGLQVFGHEAATEALSLCYTSRPTAEMIFTDIARGSFMSWGVNSGGNIQFYSLATAAASARVFGSDDIVAGSLSLVRRLPPVRRWVYRFRQNHTVLSEVAGSVSDVDALMLRTEWQMIAFDANLPANQDMPHYTDSVVQETNLPLQSGHELAQLRQQAVELFPRHVWRLRLMRLYQPNLLGQTIKINHPLLQGKKALVLSIRFDFNDETTELEVRV